MTDLVLSEVFGPTVQGEGPSLGRRCAFVRLGRCNLSCRWCDTPFTWDWSGVTGISYDPSKLYRAAVHDVVHKVRAMGVPLVVVSGGEPLLQRAALGELLDALLYSGIHVEVETNGTQLPPPLWTDPAERPEGVTLRYNVSPKLAHSGDPEEQRIHPGVLQVFAALPSTAFKFVARTVADLDEVAAVVERAQIPPGQVWVMPEGVTQQTVHQHATALGTEVVARGWNMTTRLHVQVWGNRRGV